VNISIKSIPHDHQRYETVGDWFYEKDNLTGLRTLNIRVSHMPDWRFILLVGIHELIEAELCTYSGISQDKVDAFDLQFEKDHTAGKHSPIEEPGDDVNAPYYQQHQIATGIERIMAAFLLVDWNEYAETVESLSKTPHYGAEVPPE